MRLQLLHGSAPEGVARCYHHLRAPHLMMITFAHSATSRESAPNSLDVRVLTRPALAGIPHGLLITLPLTEEMECTASEQDYGVV